MADRDVLEQWFGTKAAPWWLAGLIAITSAATVGLAQIAGREVTHYLSQLDDINSFHWPAAFGAVLATVIVIAWLPEWRLPRALRVAVMLPIVHAGAALAGVTMWLSLQLRVSTVADDLPVLHVLPITAVVTCAIVLTVGAGRVIAGQRRAERMQASTIFALVQLLLVGAWMPIAIAFASRNHGGLVSDSSLEWVASPRLIALVVLPPMLGAFSFTALAIRRFELLHAHRAACATGAVVLVITATVARIQPTPLARYAYVNFTHVLLVLLLVAAGTIAALAWSLRRSTRASRDAVPGVIVEADEPVARVQIAGWLRGPRAIADAFRVLTRDGKLAVPPGAEIRAGLPAISMRLHAGQAIDVLRPGDAVRVSGFVAPPADDPFRRSAVPIPGEAGIVVTRNPADAGSFGAIALAVWRPCVAYVLVVVAIALPALAAVFEIL
jgi:hypothetical protein